MRDIVTCPICKIVEFEKIFSKDDLDFVRCAGCGLLYINPQPADEEISALYNEDYYKPWGLDTDSSVVGEMKMASFYMKLEIVEKTIKKGKVLDIGCATGFFLESAEARGWDVYGVEISEYSAGIAGEKVGADRVFNGSLMEAKYEDGFFDVVFMSDLIEHIKDIDNFMGEVRRILKKGGITAIVTPNEASLSRKITGSFWPHFKMEHLLYFSPSTMERVLERAGFKVLSQSPASKYLNLSYMERQFSAYHFPVATPLLKILLKVLPQKIREGKFMIPTGELFSVAEKVS